MLVALQITPVVLSLLVLGAHFLRAGDIAMLAAVGLLVALLPLRRRWIARFLPNARPAKENDPMPPTHVAKGASPADDAPGWVAPGLRPEHSPAPGGRSPRSHPR